MQISPTFEDFTKTYEKNQPQLVYTHLIADLETPVSAYLKIIADKTNGFLLESVEGGETRGRYSVLGLDPDLLWKVENGKAYLCEEMQSKVFHAQAEPPLEALRALLKRSEIAIPEDLPPMSAGVFGYLGYDMVRQMEHLPHVPEDMLHVPEAQMIRPTMLIIFDGVKDRMTLVTPVRPSRLSAKRAYDKAIEALFSVSDTLEQPFTATRTPLSHVDIEENLVSNTSQTRYSEMVDKAKEYIAAGDVFQVVLSQRFSAPFTLPSFDYYRALRRINPSPYLFYFNMEGLAIAGSSPEILVKLNKGKVTIRPIAGTRPRGATASEDAQFAQDLLNDPKECAEHLMLLDLGRNDVGRVAKIGSVKVTDQFFIEKYSHVMHIVSNVEGEIAPHYDAIDALKAGFPAGTVSGAPKVRAMEIIDELETHKRNIYGGAAGYFSSTGDMDVCICLRTAVLTKGQIHAQAGAGIVADSVNSAEQAECENKAKALVRAAQEAVRLAGMPRRGQ
jgi:anthranilate synthase component I